MKNLKNFNVFVNENNDDIMNQYQKSLKRTKAKKEKAKLTNLTGIEYLQSLKNKRIDRLVDRLFSSDDLDKRMDIIDDILMIIQWEYENDYDKTLSIEQIFQEINQILKTNIKLNISDDATLIKNLDEYK